MTFSGKVSGAGTLSKSSTGTAILSGANTYSGGTTINGGTIVSNGTSALGTLASVTVNSGDTLSIGVSQTISALAGSGTVTLNGNFLTVGGTDNLSSIFDGVIADGTITGGEFIKAGTGSVTLTGVSTFTGTSVVSRFSDRQRLAQHLVDGLARRDRHPRRHRHRRHRDQPRGHRQSGLARPRHAHVSNLTLGPGALVLDLSNAGSDSVNVTSAVNITGATLSLNVGTITPNESFTILTVPGSSGGLTGTFVDLDGTPGHNTITAGALTFTISYTGGDGNDIILTATRHRQPATHRQHRSSTAALVPTSTARSPSISTRWSRTSSTPSARPSA